MNYFDYGIWKLIVHFQVILWREDSPGRWSKLYEYNNHDSSVNSVCWAPHEFGLILACGSSDGAVSILSYVDASNSWEAEKIPNAHTIGCNAVRTIGTVLAAFDSRLQFVPLGELGSLDHVRVRRAPFRLRRL